MASYFFPDLSTPIGRKTAVGEGLLACIILAIIYGIKLILVYFNGAEVPELALGLIDPSFYSDLTQMFNLLYLGTALYFIHSIGKKKSTLSAIFLILWVLSDGYSEYQTGHHLLFVLYCFLLMGSIHAYRAIRIKKSFTTKAHFRK